MAKPRFQDQRDGDRQRVLDDSFVRYRLIEMDGSEKLHASPLKDYSLSGIRVISHEPVPIGQKIKMNVYINPADVSFELAGEICWCLEVDQTPTYYAGVRILADTSRDLRDWKKLFL